MEHPVRNAQGGAKVVRTRRGAQEKLAELKKKAADAKAAIDGRLNAAETELNKLMEKEKVREREKAEARAAKEAMRPGGRTESAYDADLRRAHEHIGEAIRDAKTKHEKLGAAISGGRHSAQELANQGNDIQASFHEKMQEVKRTIKGGKTKAAARTKAKGAHAKDTQAHSREDPSHARSHKSRADRSAHRSGTRAKAQRTGSERGDDFLND